MKARKTLYKNLKDKFLSRYFFTIACFLIYTKHLDNGLIGGLFVCKTTKSPQTKVEEKLKTVSVRLQSEYDCGKILL